MALEHEPLRVGERSGLAQDLFGYGQLAEVVQARRQARELDLLRRQAQPSGNSGGELRDSLGVASGVGIALVHGSRQARCGPEAGSTVGTAREVLELCQLDHVRPRGADAI